MSARAEPSNRAGHVCGPFGRGDVGFVLAQIDDVCDGFCVVSGAPPPACPFRHTGAALSAQGRRRAVLRGPRRIWWSTSLSEQRDFAATGEATSTPPSASCSRSRADRARRSSSPRSSITSRYERAGKVVRCRVAEDTALTGAAFTG